MEETKAPKITIDQTPEPEMDEVLVSVDAPATVDEPEEKADVEASAQDAGEVTEGTPASATEEAPEEDSAAGEEAAGEEPAADKADAIQAATPAAPAEARGFSAWLTINFPGHEHAVLGGVCGLAIALLVFAIGVARVLFMLVCITIGVLIGQYLDGDDRIVRVIRSLLGGDQS